MKLTDVKLDKYIGFHVESNIKTLNVRMEIKLAYQDTETFWRGCIRNWTEEVWLKQIKKAVTSWANVIRDLNGEDDITNFNKNIAKYKSVRR